MTTQLKSTSDHLWTPPLSSHNTPYWYMMPVAATPISMPLFFRLWFIQIWCCSIIPVPIHPAMWISLMNVADIWRSVLIHNTLQYQSQIHATCADLRLPVSLLQDLVYVPFCNTNLIKVSNIWWRNHRWTYTRPVYLRTHTSAHPSPTYQTPQLHHQNIGTASSRLLEKQQAPTNAQFFLHQNPYSHG